MAKNSAARKAPAHPHQADRRTEPRAGFEDVMWFRMDIGRRHNADPRWILPLLCRRGHITRDAIGAIRIGPNETYFQIPRSVEARFRDAVKRTANPGANDESAITIAPSEAPPATRHPMRDGKGGRGDNARPQRPPFRKGRNRD